MTQSPSADLALLDAFWRQPAERTVLPNGLTVIIKPDRSAALASVQVWVKTGSIHEGSLLGAGLSHFLEHMLFKGTTKREGREISAMVQAHGGYINAYTTFDRTVYYIDLPSEHLEVAIDLLSDAVLNSTLPAEEVVKEKDVILREIAMTKDDPDSRLWDTLFSSAFREHPYRNPIIGHREVFTAIEREDLVAYYKARYVPNNLVVVIVGDVVPKAALTAVEARFGAFPRKALAPVMVSAEPDQLAPRSLHRSEDVEITRAVLAWPVPGLTHADSPVLDLLAVILGGGDSSLLWQQVREKKGLVHSIDASNWNPGNPGLFTIGFTCDAGRRDLAQQAIKAVIDRLLRTPLPVSQLRKALRHMVVGEINAHKTMSGQAARLGSAEVVAGDLDFMREYFNRLREVGPADLRRVLRTWLVPGKLTCVSLDPTSAAVKPQASAPSSARPDFEQVVLKNGARLLLQPDSTLPNLHLRFIIKGGPGAEEAGRRGATALLSVLLTKDTLQRTAAEVAERIEAAGGAFFPFSGNNTFGIGAEVLPTDAGLGLSVISEAVLEAAFRSGAFGTERDAQLAGLKQDDDDVVCFARKLLRRKFFGDHPLALDASGDKQGVAALKAADLQRLMKRLCVGGNVALAVVGDFKVAALRPKLEAFLNQIPRGSPFCVGSPFSGPAHAGAFTESQPREQAVVLQGYPGPVLHADDFYVGEVADELFSGMASKLFERVREEKGLAYFVRSSRVTGIDTSMFSFIAGTQPGKEAEVLAEIEAEIERVRSGAVEEKELLRCQARLKAGRRQGMQTNSARALQAGLEVLYGRPINDWKQYDARVGKVTIRDLAKFAGTYLKKARCTQLVVRP